MLAPGESTFGADASGSVPTASFPIVHVISAGDSQIVGPGSVMSVLSDLLPSVRGTDGGVQFDSELPSSVDQMVVPGWAFANLTASGSVVIPRFGHAAKGPLVGSCGEASLTSELDGMRLTDRSHPVEATFNDHHDGVVVRTTDGSEHSPEQEDARALLLAVLNGSDHLTVIPTDETRTLLPAVRVLRQATLPARLVVQEGATPLR